MSKPELIRKLKSLDADIAQTFTCQCETSPEYGADVCEAHKLIDKLYALLRRTEG